MDTLGSSFPSSGTSPGHEHLDITTGKIYRYLRGDPSIETNWILIDGQLISDPNTSSWGTSQAGARWFNKIENQYKGWNGLQIVLLG